MIFFKSILYLELKTLVFFAIFKDEVLIIAWCVFGHRGSQGKHGISENLLLGI